MKVKATVLCENYVLGNRGALAEHGLSIFLETDYGNYLMDTGSGKAIVNNSLVFGCDLKTVKGIIISHNHWDHTGGLIPVLEVKGEMEIYSHPGLFRESYFFRDGGYHYIGVPFTRQAIEDRNVKFNFSTEFREIAPGLWLTGEVPRITEYEIGHTNQVLKTESGYLKDNVIDDQSIVIETGKGLLVILGCCHSGIINTLNYIFEKMGSRHIYAVIGGTHLAPVSEEQREKSIGALKGFDIERIGISHCSGLKTAVRMVEDFGDRFFFCNVGTTIEA
jgi:7,8-dihydropterin-6-yl-methyl-4-(beta-D-ribofuranosyl)aminobenzene 5'-phosphate synthase